MDDIDLVIRHMRDEHDAVNLDDFIRESNAIEGIYRAPTLEETNEHKRFLALKKITVHQLKKFVSVVAPGHVIRDKERMQVYIGGKMAPEGGKQIPRRLKTLLERMELAILTPWETHQLYEHLHPFTDGNGRSGRALWLWQQKEVTSLGFLHKFYYETLAHFKC